MKGSERSLVRRLRQAGMTLAEVPAPSPPETPWFVKTLLAISGWLAAVMIFGFMGLAMNSLLDNATASLTLAGLLLALAYGLLRRSGNDFIEHSALAISLTGQLLVAWVLAAVLTLDESGSWGWLALLQSCLALLMTSFLHRVFSSFAASVAGYFALTTLGLPYLINGLLLLVLVWIWLNEWRWLGRLRAMQAWGYGVTLGLLAIQLLTQVGQPWGGWMDSSQRWGRAWESVWVGAWSGELLSTLALLLLIWRLLHHSGRYVAPRMRLAAYGCAVLLLPASLFAFGLTQGALIVALGFAISHRLLLGLGVVSLLFSITSYYYLLDATLLSKSMTLLALGVLLLAIRWWLRRQGLTGEAGDA